MTSVLDATPLNVMDVLRGERESRPPTNASAAAGLRATLEDGIYERLGPDLRSEPIIVRASSLRQGPQVFDPTTAPLAQLRGILITQSLRLMSAGVEIDDVCAELLLAWRAEELARLSTDLTAHWVTLKRSLGPLSNRWLPRTSLRAYQRLAGGNVVLRDVVDLMVGTTSGEVASVALLDVTTSPLGEGAERVMRYHALVQTLRTSIVPLRTSMFSTATGELWSIDVNDELLWRSVTDVFDALEGWRAA
jgi:hypothetical protein